MREIRLLTSNDIDVRVAGKNKTKTRVQLLLFKNARVDMEILDETYGAGNWQTDYKEINDVLFCGIGVWVSNQWVWKWSNGVESKGMDEGNNTKGEASDALKRAGFLWGIGRELYNCKNIWVPYQEGDNSYFTVKEIEFDRNTLTPTKIEILDSDGNICYSLGKKIEKKTNKTQDTKESSNYLTVCKLVNDNKDKLSLEQVNIWSEKKFQKRIKDLTDEEFKVLYDGLLKVIQSE